MASMRKCHHRVVTRFFYHLLVDHRSPWRKKGEGKALPLLVFLVTEGQEEIYDEVCRVRQRQPLERLTPAEGWAGPAARAAAEAVAADRFRPGERFSVSSSANAKPVRRMPEPGHISEVARGERVQCWNFALGPQVFSKPLSLRKKCHLADQSQEVFALSERPAGGAYFADFEMTTGVVDTEAPRDPRTAADPDEWGFVTVRYYDGGSEAGVFMILAIWTSW